MMTLPERMTSRLLKASVVALTTMALSGCGSDQAGNGFGVAGQVFKQIFTKKQPPAPITQAQIANARAATNKSNVLVSIEKLQAQALFVEIERNGAVITYGTAARQSISLENGVIRGTRGLGGDLMSTDHSLLRYSINTGKSNGGTRVLRYLDAASQTVVQNVSCSYTAGSTIVETCVGEDGQVLFTNTFEKAGSTIVNSKQWVSETLGYVEIARVQ